MERAIGIISGGITRGECKEKRELKKSELNVKMVTIGESRSEHYLTERRDEGNGHRGGGGGLPGVDPGRRRRPPVRGPAPPGRGEGGGGGRHRRR